MAEHHIELTVREMLGQLIDAEEPRADLVTDALLLGEGARISQRRFGDVDDGDVVPVIRELDGVEAIAPATSSTRLPWWR